VSHPAPISSWIETLVGGASPFIFLTLFGACSAQVGNSERAGPTGAVGGPRASHRAGRCWPTTSTISAARRRQLTGSILLMTRRFLVLVAIYTLGVPLGRLGRSELAPERFTRLILDRRAPGPR
jgi:hypothetical protein